MPFGFWQKLKKPILALAPMAEVTDSPFRQIVAQRGKPDVFFTEFVSADGLCSGGKDTLVQFFLNFTDIERPIIAQLFGAKPENFYRSAKLIKKLGFDGIDLNMGCPFKAVEKQGAGAALMLNPKLAQKIIQETKKGAEKIPVSVKTRIGYYSDVINHWIPQLLKAEPAVITIHARTRMEKSKVPAHWNAIAQAVKIVRKNRAKTLIIGNGDVQNLFEAKRKAKEYQADGVMIGRAVLKNPWLFNSWKKDIALEERLHSLIEHARIYEEFFENKKNFLKFRKFFATYVSDFPGAKKLRIKLMHSNKAQEIEKIIESFLKQ